MCSVVVYICVRLMYFGMCSTTSTINAEICKSTDSSEVDALREAARELGKPDWNCTDDPCAKRPSCWFSDDVTRLHYVNEITCLCQNGMNHVKNISFKGQDLSGVLPGSLSKLPFLQIIEELLSGPIPREWTSMKNLTYFSIMANNLSGPIPTYLGSITSLTYLSVESNRFSGAVPAELGHLVNLKNLILNDNNLTGRLPEELNNLNNLIELRLSSNNFNGPVPDYFGSWTKLQKLEIQGSGFDGPIPPTISLLHNISELRITDLSRDGSKFPSLKTMGNLKRLGLRNCNISGSIPDYIVAKLPLVELDLSFNRLEGSIPSNSSSFPAIENMYLMHNNLTGQVPDWMTKNTGKSFKNIDLSYNSLDEMTVGCNGLENINLFRSFKGEKNLESTMCIKESNPCSKVVNSLHINCGGASTKVGKTTYEQDTTQGGAAKFVRTGVWGFSSSGDYWFAKDKSDYIVRNSALGVNDSVLYQDARIAASSLTYYGLCLARGRYRVTRRFFEIVFGSNKSFSSLGNRKFDIYIQEMLVYKDFDIQSNGIDKPVTLVFPNMYVDNSIEIRLYYAGKGSTAIPARETGAYGPLISAISVESELKRRLSRKIIIWISIGGVSLLVLFVLLGLWKRFWRGKVTSREDDDLVGLDLQTGLFTYRQIKAATNNFDSASMIGKGGFGSVYLGRLLDGTNIAVKKLSSKSSQGNREFINEIGMISGLHHPNLVKLYGCCIEGNQLFVIYEYMENNNLARLLFGPDDDDRMILDWPARKRISIDVARGLTFLHEESTFKVVHRDIKATNILLDRNLNAKISDFGLAKLDDEEHTHISTRVVGTIGYMAPEYALWGYLTYKADVYSFGVLLLEIVAGRNNTKFRPEENQFCLLDRAFVLQQKGDLRELVDPRLGQEYNAEEAIRMLKVALLCTNTSPELRPDMSSVLAMLDGTTLVHDPIPNPIPNMPSKEWLYHQISRTSHNEVGSEKDTQSLIISGGAPGYESSSKSEHDLYPVNLRSDD